MKPFPMDSRFTLGMRVDNTTYDDATRRIIDWARGGESRYVCVATVHMVMESHDSDRFRGFVNGADLVTADGMPLVWSLRAQGMREASRVYGPHLTESVVRAAEREHLPVGFYGGTPEVLRELLRRMSHRLPNLRIVYAWPPPFRPLTPDEDEKVLQEIQSSGARVLFVGIGCPKQETWMAEHRGCIDGVMLGVGAAFDFLAGAKPQAPAWMQASGLEWLFRLVTEPRRLWRRYLKQNPRFLALVIMQWLSALGRNLRA